MEWIFADSSVVQLLAYFVQRHLSTVQWIPYSVPLMKSVKRIRWGTYDLRSYCRNCRGKGYQIPCGCASFSSSFSLTQLSRISSSFRPISLSCVSSSSSLTEPRKLGLQHHFGLDPATASSFARPATMALVPGESVTVLQRSGD